MKKHLLPIATRMTRSLAGLAGLATCIMLALGLAACETAAEFDPAFGPGGGEGTGGSLARFTVMGDRLFTVDNQSLNVFDIADPANVTQENDIFLGVGIETVYPYDGRLFVGSTTGMHIFDVTSFATPVKLSTYEHVTSCDPVVVQGDLAYVTLRSATDCRWGSNLLVVVDISDPASPFEVATYPMENPHGLGIDGTDLFVTEGDFGLKLMDATEANQITTRQWLQNENSWDCIPLNGTLLVVGTDGLRQYSYGDGDELVELSRIAVVQD